MAVCCNKVSCYFSLAAGLFLRLCGLRCGVNRIISKNETAGSLLRSRLPPCIAYVLQREQVSFPLHSSLPPVIGIKGAKFQS